MLFIGHGYDKTPAYTLANHEYQRFANIKKGDRDSCHPLQPRFLKCKHVRLDQLASQDSVIEQSWRALPILVGLFLISMSLYLANSKNTMPPPD
jgi:hypothetical protein